MAVSGIALGEITVGALLLWSGITNKPFADIARTLAKGGTVPAPSSSQTSITTEETQQLASDQSGAGDSGVNKLLGQLMAGGYGWATGDNWAFLESGWEEESGWSATAINGTWPDCAYGIPQANPGSKMPQSAWPSYAGGSSSATAQIAWGLAYIKSTYGAPVNVPGWSASGPTAGYEGY
jgi:hypothetical protein